MKHIGLFEGIGGFSLAARWMGWNTIAWCEINPFGQKVLKHHFPNATGHSDIKETDFTIYRRKCDILTGGFPCQPYSMAGKRLGTEDDRHLWPEMLRAIREIQPGYVVGENVSGLTNWNGGLVFDQVQADLENEGYEVLPFLLPACAVNAPHRRDRIWFVAYSVSSSAGPSRKSGSTKSNGCGNDAKPEQRGEQTEQHNGCNDVLRNVRNPCGLGLERGIQTRIVKKQNGESRPKQEIIKYLQSSRDGLQFQNFPTQSPICSGNDGLPSGLAGITFSKHRQESIKGFGNAIVPQVVYQIFKAIQEMEDNPVGTGRE